MKRYFAVLDTNVIVSAVLSSTKGESVPVRILESALYGRITPLYNSAIFSEYEEVLKRKKFQFPEQAVSALLRALLEYGKLVESTQLTEVVADRDDQIFYETALAIPGAYLVTGNLKHFPAKAFIVSPAQMADIVLKETV